MNNIIEIPFKDKIFTVDVSRVKRKTALKLAKLLKKHRKEPEILIEEMEKMGIHVKMRDASPEETKDLKENMPEGISQVIEDAETVMEEKKED